MREGASDDNQKTFAIENGRFACLACRFRREKELHGAFWIRENRIQDEPRAPIPAGVLSFAGAVLASVQTAEGEFFIPASKVADAFDGDMVEVTRLPGASQRSSRSVDRLEQPVLPHGVVRVLSRAHECNIVRAL